MKSAQAQAKNRREALKVELAGATLQELLAAVHARDGKAAEEARGALVGLGPEVVPAAREMAMKTGADPLKRELVAVLGSFKEPAASEAIAEVYAAQGHERRAVKEAAALALGRLAHPPAAAALGRLLRQEKDPAFKTVLGRLYSPLAHLDPQGVADDPQVRHAKELAARQAASAREIQGLDPAKDADFARLRELAASPELSPAHRVAALHRIAQRKEAAVADVLSGAARNPGEDPDGLVRTNALGLLFRSPASWCASAVNELLADPDDALRRAALLTAQGSAADIHRLGLERVKGGNFPEDHRRLASQALERLAQR